MARATFNKMRQFELRIKTKSDRMLRVASTTVWLGNVDLKIQNKKSLASHTLGTTCKKHGGSVKGKQRETITNNN